MSDPGNHHYLPVFYLKQWCGRDKKVIRYWRPQGHDRVVAGPVAPKHTAYEPNLYGLEACPPEKRNAIERELMGPKVDGPGAEALRILLEDDRSLLTPDVRIHWTRFLMSMKIRNPATLAGIENRAKEGLQRDLSTQVDEYDSLRDADDPPTLYEWAIVNQPATVANFGKRLFVSLIGDEKIGEAILGMRWFRLDISTGPFTLLTSDNPVVLTHTITDDRCLVALPLTPHVGFLATRRLTTAENIRGLPPKVVAMRFNESVVNQAVKHVYGDSRNHLRFVENRLRRR